MKRVFSVIKSKFYPNIICLKLENTNYKTMIVNCRASYYLRRRNLGNVGMNISIFIKRIKLQKKLNSFYRNKQLRINIKGL